jgi:O-antigen ligase
MNASSDSLDLRLLFWSFAFFAFTCTFSIALAQLSLGLSAAIFIVFALRHRYNPFAHPLRWFYMAVAAWIVWLLFTGLLGDTPLRSWRLSREEWLFVAVPIGVLLFQDRRRQAIVLGALAVGVGLVGIYGLIQYPTGFNLIPRHRIVEAPGYGYRVLAAFNHYMTFSNFYAVVAAFLSGYTLAAFGTMNRFRRYLFGASSVLAILMTLLSFGRGAVASLIIVLMLTLVLLGRKYARVSIIGIAALVVILLAIPGVTDRYFSDYNKDASVENPGGRLFIWEHSFQVIADHPLFGVGMGNFKDAYAAKLPEGTPENRYYAHAHNDALNVAAISGIPGLVLFGLLWLTVLGYCWYGFRQTRHDDPEAAAGYFAALVGSLCFAATSVTEATFVDEEVRQLLMFVWAVGLAGWYKTKSDRTVRG